MLLRLGLLAGLSGLAFGSFYVWLARRRWSLLDTLVGAFLLLAVQVFCVQMLLLAVGLLGLWQTVVLHLFLSAGIWIWAGRDIPETIGWTWRELGALRASMTWYSWGASVMLGLLVLLVAATVFYSPDLGWDANMYHIPIAASRLQEGNLQRLHSGWAYIEGYPETVEMFILWNLLFTGTQALADAAQLPFWLFGALAIISLSLKMKAKLPYAVVSILLWMFAPVAILHAQFAGTDLIVASLFWMGMNFAYRRPASLLSISLVGLAAGLLVGTKLVALGLVAVLVLFTAAVALRSPNRRVMILSFLAVWLGFGALNAYWYFSNWKHTGNPIWPVDFAAGSPETNSFSMEGYEEWYTPSELEGKPIWQQAWLVWLEPDTFYSEAAKLTGFGPLWLLLGVPAILAWALLEQTGWPLILTSLLVLLVQPVAWHARFVLFLPGLGAIALAVVLSRLGIGARVLTKLVLVGGAVFSFLQVFDARDVRYLWIPTSYRAQVYSAWPMMGGAYRWFDTNARAPANVVYGGRAAFPAPLWGEDLRHEVTYIVASDRESWERTAIDRGTNWVFAVSGSTADQFLKDSAHFKLVVDDRRMDYPPTLPSRIYQSVRETATND